MEQGLAICMAALVLGVIPGAVAKRKGQGFFVWWIYGALLFIVATPHAFMVSVNRNQLDIDKAKEGYGRCPACAEMVRYQAKVCRYCRNPLEA